LLFRYGSLHRRRCKSSIKASASSPNAQVRYAGFRVAPRRETKPRTRDMHVSIQSASACKILTILRVSEGNISQVEINLRRSGSRERIHPGSEDTISRWRKARLASAQSLSRPQLVEYAPLYCTYLSPTLILPCILLLPSVGIAFASRLCVVAIFHLTRLTRPQQSVPTAATMYNATMHPHASNPAWFILRNAS
jgi:hypothetical protein